MFGFQSLGNYNCFFIYYFNFKFKKKNETLFSLLSNKLIFFQSWEVVENKQFNFCNLILVFNLCFLQIETEYCNVCRRYF